MHETAEQSELKQGRSEELQTTMTTMLFQIMILAEYVVQLLQIDQLNGLKWKKYSAAEWGP